MAGEINRALEALNQRKDAIMDRDESGAIGDQEFVMLLSGFDLDPAEIIRSAEVGAEHCLLGMVSCSQSGLPVNGALGSLWLDGLAVGLLIAQERERKAGAAE